jgi:hypothetical protein
MAEEKKIEIEEPEANPPTPPTSSDIVKFGPIVKKLETRISILEDSNKTLTERNTSLENEFGKLRQVPSKTPGKSLWDDVNEFLFGPTQPPKV